MWTDELVQFLTYLGNEYGTTVIMGNVQSAGELTVKISKGGFYSLYQFNADVVESNKHNQAFFNDEIERVAKEIADAYDSTNKSKAWNETLQEIGVREG